MHMNTAAADEAARDDSPAVPLVTVLVMATLQQRAAAPHAEVTVNARSYPESPGIPRIRPPVMAAHTSPLQGPNPRRIQVNQKDSAYPPMRKPHPKAKQLTRNARGKTKNVPRKSEG